MITEEQLAEWRKLCDAATDGPWEAGGSLVNNWVNEQPDPIMEFDVDEIADEDETQAGRDARRDRCNKTAAFIAAARTAMPALIAEVERLRDERSCECCRNYQCDCLK